MTIHLYDPSPFRNEYFSVMFAKPMMAFQRITKTSNLDSVKNSIVVVLTDHLSEDLIQKLKNNNCKIVGFNVTDSSYFSESIRHCKSLESIDLIFMVSGVPNVNTAKDFKITPDFGIETFSYPFLPEHEWFVFDRMRKKQLKSLPYVPWTPIPDYPWTQYAHRSQKVLLRGGGHSRRFILGLFLMKHQLLDINSAMMLGFYFEDGMNPAFRFCDACRKDFRSNKQHYPYSPPIDSGPCNSPARHGNTWSLENLGYWNNRCPRSYYWMAEKFQKRYGPVNIGEVETLLNGKWIHDLDHQKMLSRILFTSDLKWIHSIYAPQRFWQGANAGCVNLLPNRTAEQDYFPEMKPDIHYLTFNEDMQGLDLEAKITEREYVNISKSARSIYDDYLRTTDYSIGTPILKHIFDSIRAI